MITMIKPKLIHPIKVTIEIFDPQETEFDDDFNTPVEPTFKEEKLIIQAQPNYMSDRAIVSQGGGFAIEPSFYLFVYTRDVVDENGKYIVIPGSRVVEVKYKNKISNDILNIIDVTPKGNYGDSWFTKIVIDKESIR